MSCRLSSKVKDWSESDTEAEADRRLLSAILFPSKPEGDVHTGATGSRRPKGLGVFWESTL